MPSKILVLLGSPRKGSNSTYLARSLAEGARSAGAEVEEVMAHRLTIHPCSACEGCHQEGAKGCVIQDDMIPLYDRLVRADAIVFASPIYWFTFSAQIKLIIDRFYALDGPHGNALAGKPVAILLTYGDRDPIRSGAVNAIRTFQDAFHYLRSPIVGMVFGTGTAEGVLVNGEALAEEARELGVRLARGE
jgi:multimeric flavodoxin WrbA